MSIKNILNKIVKTINMPFKIKEILKNIFKKTTPITPTQTTEILKQLEQNLNIELIGSKRIYFNSLGTLTSLHLAGFGVKSKDLELIGKLTGLEYLGLAYNEIVEIEGLDKLTNLTCLSLNYNKITEMKGLNRLTNLRDLRLSDNKITEMKGLNRLTNLTYLDLSDNKIEKIKGLWGLWNLKSLSLGGNRIYIIQGFWFLNNLRYVYLSGNHIKNKICSTDDLKIFY